MDKQEYLNQISASVRPVKPPKKGFSGLFSSTIFKVVLGGVIALILIMILGLSLGGGKTTFKDDAIMLNIYMDSTMGAISNYQGNLKSSALRSHSASLYSVLSNTKRDVSGYLTEVYGSREAEPTKTMEADEQLHADGLNSDLFNAKINGILDRIFAHKMAYEITMIMSRESALYERASDAELKSALESSHNSLSTLYSEFNEFSETK